MNKRSALFSVFFVVMIDLIGFGIVLPGLENYAAGMNATPLFTGLIYSAYSFAQLLFAPVWGSVSDRIGRRPVMMLSTLGASLAYLLFAFSSSLWMLLFCRAFAGVMAGNISTAQAYVADVTDGEGRAKGMGLIGAAFGIGFVIGPALGGLIMKFFPDNPFRMIGFLASALSALSFFFVMTRLPEPPRERRSAADGRVVRNGIFSLSFWNDLKEVNRRSGGVFGGLLFCVFLLTLGQASIYVAFPYLCRTQLDLPVAAVYQQYVLMGLAAVFIQGGLIRVLVKRFPEKNLFLSGSAIFALSLAAVPFAQNSAQLTIVMLAMTAGAGISVPTLTSLVSKQSPADSYGVTMGLSQSFSAAARAIGPAWGSALLGVSFRAPFMITGGLVLLTLLTGLRFKRPAVH